MEFWEPHAKPSLPTPRETLMTARLILFQCARKRQFALWILRYPVLLEEEHRALSRGLAEALRKDETWR
jgi:hypothetical protein